MTLKFFICWFFWFIFKWIRINDQKWSHSTEFIKRLNQSSSFNWFDCTLKLIENLLMFLESILIRWNIDQLKTFLSFGHLKVWIEFFIRSTFFKNWSFWFYQVCQLGLCWSICIPRQDQFLSFNRFKNDFIDFSPSKIKKKYFRKMNSSLDDSYLVWK